MPHVLKRPDVRLGMLCAAGAVALGVGGFLLGGGTDASHPLGPALAIALVPPVEREVLPGETMEVGALNNGFDRAALERVAEASPIDILPEDAWVGPPLSWPDEPPSRPPPPVIQVAEQPAPRVDPLADGSRAFGFDRPRPDYAAERRLRWDHLEAALPAASPAQETPAAPVNSDVTPIKYSSE